MGRKLWTEEQKRLQSQKIRQWKPWKKSTGAKTIQGKNRSKMNALKHGMRSKEVLDLKKAANVELRSFKESLKELDISTKEFDLFDKALALEKLMSFISD